MKPVAQARPGGKPGMRGGASTTAAAWRGAGRWRNLFSNRGVARLLLPLMAALCLVAPAVAADRPLAPLDVTSPRATLRSFLDEARRVEAAFVAYRAAPDHEKLRAFDRRVARMAGLFDTRAAPHAVREEVAAAAVGFLYDILLRLPPEDLSRALDAAPEGDPSMQWRIPNTEIAITRVAEGEQAGSWLFSPRTVALLPAYHAAIIHLPLQQPSAVENWHLAQSNLSGPFFYNDAIDRLPAWMRQAHVLDTPLWKLVLTVALWIGVVLVLLLWLQLVGRSTLGAAAPIRALARLSAPVLLAAVVIGVRRFVLLEISLSGGAFAQAERAISLMAVYVAWAWAAWLVIIGLVETIASLPLSRDHAYHANLARFIGKVLALASASFVLVLGLNEVGVPALGLLAGLGFGGFAIALAGKSTLENLFSGLTLFADKPFRVGDYIHYGEGAGVVENVGPRSSRLRGLDGTLTAVPNTELVTARITNYTARTKCLFLHTLGLRYGAAPEQLQRLLEAFHATLARHPLVEDAPGMPRVRLTGFGESAIEVELRAHVLTTEYAAFLAVQQELLLEVMRCVAEHGLRLATRTQTVLIEQDRSDVAEGGGDDAPRPG